MALINVGTSGGAPVQAKGMILRSHFDFTDQGSADIVGESTVAWTPNSGTVTDPVTFTVGSMAGMASSVVLSASGMTWTLTYPGNGEWFNAAAPTCPHISTALSGLLGGAPEDDAIVVVGTLWGDVTPGQQYNFCGHALRDGNDSLHVLHEYRSAARQAAIKRNTVATASVPTALAATWLLGRYANNGVQGRAGTDATMPTDWTSGTELPSAIISADAPSAYPLRFDLPASSLYVFASAKWAAWTPVLKALSVWEVVL